MGKHDTNKTQDAFQQAASDVLAQKVEAIALELRKLSGPEAGTYASYDTLSVLAMTLQRILEKIDDIFEFEGFVFTPACHILLELYQVRARGGLLSVSALCQNLNCYNSVALRWIVVLANMQLLEKLNDEGLSGFPCAAGRLIIRPPWL